MQRVRVLNWRRPFIHEAGILSGSPVGTRFELWSFAELQEAIRSARWMSLGRANLRNNRAGYR